MSIHICDLAKRYPGDLKPVLDGVCLSVDSGQIAAVLGQSGAGKSTLLRCLVGLETFDRGSIEVRGTRVEAGSSGMLFGKVGLVFQAFELFPHLSVLENCTLAPRRVHKLSRAAADAEALSWLGELGLAEKAHALPKTLSGGQKQRVAIARALCMKPEVLLYDEPTSALDPALKADVGKLIRRIQKREITQIVVTHDVALAREIAELVFVLNCGRIVDFGPPSLVLSPAAGHNTSAGINC